MTSYLPFLPPDKLLWYAHKEPFLGNSSPSILRSVRDTAGHALGDRRCNMSMGVKLRVESPARALSPFKVMKVKGRLINRVTRTEKKE